MTMTRENVKEAANTIYQQFGGGRAKAMIGMNAMGYDTDEDGNPFLSFKFKAGRKANYCKITLTPMDVYNMSIQKVSYGYKKGLQCKVVAEHDGIYSDMLKPLFEKATGLYLSL
jgi:hypothetical protein